MARPERNNVDYFPFICEDGNKMFYIEETYGNDGFATFVKLLRELAKTNYHYLDLSKPSTMMFLSAKCKVSKEVLNSIISDLVDLGKFDKTLWDENKIIWCQDFIDSIQDAYSKRNNKCITLDSLRILLTSLGVLKQSKLPTKGDVKPQSILEDNKEYKSKVKKSKVIEYPSEIEFLEYCKFTLNEKYEPLEFSLKAKYQSWLSNEWKDGNDNDIKNWKTKISNTIPYLKPMYNGNKQANSNDRKTSLNELSQIANTVLQQPFTLVDNNPSDSK